MTPAAALDTLTARTADEIAALDAGDLDALMAATRAKLATLGPLRCAQADALGALPREAIARAAELNIEAARRINVARARVERRLAALARAAGNDPALAYGPHGRMTSRVLRP